MREIAAELIDDLPPSGRVDLMPAYAFLLPVLVICELLGVPAEDRDDFAAWSNVMVDERRQDASMAAAGEAARLPVRADRDQARGSRTTR